MKPREMTYDERSYDLAVYFLADHPEATEREKIGLARTIQSALEDWLRNYEAWLDRQGDTDAK